jgi:hypothetical protein
MAAFALPATAAAHTITSHSGPLLLTSAPGTNATSTNWSGYAATGPKNSFTSVSSNWVEPTGKCSSSASYSSFWVGLDGATDGTVEQTGTSVDCSGGSPQYYAWYEMYPKFPKQLPLTISPGDHISASVTTDGAGNFTLKLSDTTTGKHFSTTKTLASAKLKSAEVIAEAPSSGSTGQVLPLTNFGKANFSNAQVNGANLGTTNPLKITMVQNNGNPKATPSAITGGNAFSVTWNHK